MKLMYDTKTDKLTRVGAFKPGLNIWKITLNITYEDGAELKVFLKGKKPVESTEVADTVDTHLRAAIIKRRMLITRLRWVAKTQ